MGDKSLNLLVRQVKPTSLKIVFSKYLEAMEEPSEALLRLVVTGAHIMGPGILPAAVTYKKKIIHQPWKHVESDMPRWENCLIS